MSHRGLPPWLLLIAGVGAAYAQVSEVAPTELEAFVADPAVTVVDDSLFGEIRSTESTIAISIVEAVATWGPSRTMRGARIDLGNNAWHASVYLGKEQMGELALQLQMMARILREQREESHPRHDELLFGDRTIGTQQCWILHPNRERILCPSFRIVNGFETFVIQVNGASGEVFPLETEQLVEFARIVEGAGKHLEAEVASEGGADNTLLELSEQVVSEIRIGPEVARNAEVPVDPPAAENNSRRHGSIVLGSFLVAALVAGLAALGRQWRG